MKPLGTRLLVEWLPHRNKGVIQLLEEDFHNAPDPKLYRVIEAGPGRRLKDGTIIPLEVSPGDRVLCSSTPTRNPIDTDDPKRKIIYAEDVIAVMRI